MRDVWFVFKLVEAMLSVICIGIHVDGFLYRQEPLPHHMFFCGTFFGFTIISIIGDVALCTGASTPFLIEAIIASFGAFFYILSSVCSMYHAEQDFHLMYLSDLEESQHRFFVTSKVQSISSLICGITYLLHAIFSVDALLVTEESIQRRKSARLSAYHISDYDESKRPIELNLFCFTFFERYNWFQKCMYRITTLDNDYIEDIKSTTTKSNQIPSFELNRMSERYTTEEEIVNENLGEQSNPTVFDDDRATNSPYEEEVQEEEVQEEEEEARQSSITETNSPPNESVIKITKTESDLSDDSTDSISTSMNSTLRYSTDSLSRHKNKDSIV